MKLAQYKSAYNVIVPSTPDYMPDGWVQISEIIDVEFTPLPKADVIAAEVKIIDEMADKLRYEFGKQIDGLKQRKEELLALTYQDNNDPF